MGSLTKWIIVVLVAFAALYLGLLFVAAFAAVMVYLIWEFRDRVKELERRVEELSSGKPSEAPPPV